MDALLRSSRGGWWLGALVVLGLALFFGSLVSLMLPYAEIVAARSDEDLTCLQLPFTRARAIEIVDSYDTTAREAARALHYPGDAIFPIGYALLYVGLLGLVVRDLDGRWRRAGLWVLWLPVVAAVADWIENGFMVRMLTVADEAGSAAIPVWMPLAGSLFATLKYVALSVISPLFGLAAIGRLLTGDRRRAARVAVYLVVALLLLFNIIQVAGSVGPCLARLV